MIKETTNRYPCLGECEKDIREATDIIISCYKNGGKLLLCGNGGSAADCEHISGELMKSFLRKRPLPESLKEKITESFGSSDAAEKLEAGLPAISLPSLTSFNTAFSNDADPVLSYAQALLALGRKGDVLLALTTSGNSENILCAAKTAAALGITVIALTGKNGGKISMLADVSVRVPEEETYKIQELHLPVYHCICGEIEKAFFG